jgi:outer membrane autotransporter protein
MAITLRSRQYYYVLIDPAAREQAVKAVSCVFAALAFALISLAPFSASATCTPVVNSATTCTGTVGPITEPSGTIITNHGTIDGGADAAITFTGSNANTVDNFGTISTSASSGGVLDSPGPINFLNEPSAHVSGGLLLSAANDNVTLYPGSVVTGNGNPNVGTLDGRGGSNTLFLTGPASTLATADGTFNDFQLLNKTGAGTWTLSGLVGDNSGIKPLTVSVQGGTLILTGNTPGLSTDSMVVAPGGTLQFGNGGAAGLFAGDVTDNGTLAFDRNTTVTFPGLIFGTGALSQIGSGTTILTTDNTYTGGTTIAAGTLQLGDGGTTGSIVGNVTNNAMLAFNRSNSVTFPGVISGTGELGQIGSGTTILTGDNTYTGGTNIAAGTLQLGNGGTSGSIVGNITDNGTLAVDRSDVVTLPGVIFGPGRLNQIGPGTTVLTGENVYVGGTTISAGTLQLGNGGDTGSIVGNVTDNGTLTFDHSDVVTFPGTISGTGTLSQIGTGTTVLTTNDTYTGGTTITAGTLQLGNGGTTGSIVGNVTDDGTLAFGRGNTVTFPGLISGIGGVSQIGPGTTILTTDNTYTGGTTIEAGTLQLGNGGTTGSIVGDVTDNATLEINRSNQVTLPGTISGTGELIQVGPGTTILTGDNTYTGGTTISAGTLQLGNGGTSGSIVGNVTDNGTLAVDNSNVVTLPGVIFGPGQLNQIGPGTTTLTGDNTYTGGTTISAGTLQLGNGGDTGSIVGNVTDNGTLAFDRGDVVTFPGTISGTGSLSQIGTGTTILTADNTYTGGTTISAGTLQLGNGGNTGSIVGNVTDNGTLAFARGDVVTFPGVISGTGAVTQIGPGATILTANNTYTGGTTVSLGTLAIGDPTHPGAALSGGGPIQVSPDSFFGGYGSVTGTVTNDGTIAVANALPVFAGGPSGTFVINGNLVNGGGLVNLASTSTIGNVLAVRGNYSSNGGTLALNTVLNAGGPLSNQSTDRLLISGNATGVTTIQVNPIGAGALTNTNGVGPAKSQGISIVQVGGTSAAGAFQLVNGYVASSSGIAYKLFQFGPGSSFGPADPGQLLVGGSNSWDYRLESSFVTNGPSTRLEVAPQVASYVTIPTALFNAGFQNLDELHRRLGEIHDDQLEGRTQQDEVFVRAFGETFNYTSNRSFTDFGYNSQQDYAAVQFGDNWIASDAQPGTLRLGLFGTIGRLWFQPSSADGPSSGVFNEETLSGTVTWQARNGWYVDGIISSGMFDGTVSTTAHGQVTGMNGTTIATSLETGYPIPIADKIALEPEVQGVFQHLDFPQRTDADGIGVNLGTPNQGVLRAGVRLLDHVTTTDGTLVTPYLKANFLQGLGGGNSVQLSNVTFPVGDFGSALQIGGGVNGTLTRNLSLYGDVAWQNQIGNGGFRGWAFNGGLRYAFGGAPVVLPAVPVPPTIARTYLVFFYWDKADLTERARQIVAEAAANSHNVQLTRIEVDGFADTSGTHRYNQRLSLRRAKAVADELERDGVKPEAIEMHGYGDTHLLVATGPGVRNAQNRRVEIIFH